MKIYSERKNMGRNRILKHPITCKCGKYWGKRYTGKLCKRCKTKVTFKMEHKNEDNR